MKIDKKIKECFEPHIMMHSLFGLGLGLLLVSLIPGLASSLLGLLLMAAAIVMDMMRK